MPAQIIRIREAPFGYGIPYLAVLAYPYEREKQGKFIEAAETLIYKDLINKKKVSRKDVPERYRKMKNATIESTIRAGLRRIRDNRLCAANFAFTRAFNRHLTDDEFVEEAKLERMDPKSRIFITTRYLGLIRNSCTGDELTRYERIGAVIENAISISVQHPGKGIYRAIV